MLRIEGLNSFYGRAHILFDLGLQAAKGEVVALLGRNGAGKSTTLKSIIGLVTPVSGRIEFEGRRIEGEGAGYFWSDELFVSSADEHTRGATRVQLAFQANDEATVQRFHAAGLAAGGTDNGAPGLRPYHPGYYGAFVIDPDGNNIEAVFHGPARRSADSVTVTF